MWKVYDVDLRGCFGRTLPLHEGFLLLFYAYVVICNFGLFIYYYVCDFVVSFEIVCNFWFEGVCWNWL